MFAWISWAFDKRLSETIVSRLWLKQFITHVNLCTASGMQDRKSSQNSLSASKSLWRKCTSRDADLKVQVSSFQVVKRNLLQTCSLQLWEALDGNRLQPHALPQHGGPRMVTLRKRQTGKEKHYFQSQPAFFQSFGCDPAQTHLFVILKGSWFICFWSELEFYNKAYLQDLGYPSESDIVQLKCLAHLLQTNHQILYSKS